MRSWTHRITILLVGALLLGVISVTSAVSKTKQVPDFYAQAVFSLPASTKQASRHLAAGIERLPQDVCREWSWWAKFSADELNAWMPEGLPEKFPQLLAEEASEPRIVIESGRLLAAVRYRNKHIDTSISRELRVELTKQPNVLALRIDELMAGSFCS